MATQEHHHGTIANSILQMTAKQMNGLRMKSTWSYVGSAALSANLERSAGWCSVKYICRNQQLGWNTGNSPCVPLLLKLGTFLFALVLGPALLQNWDIPK